MVYAPLNKTSGFVSSRKTHRTQKCTTQKVYKNPPLFQGRLCGRLRPKGLKTLRFKRIWWEWRSCSFSSDSTTKEPKKASVPKPEIPINQVRNRGGENQDTSRGPDSPSERPKWDQISPPTAYMYIYIYGWLVPRHLPTFLGSQPISHPRLAKKKAFFFLHKFVRKKNRVFALDMKKKGF